MSDAHNCQLDIETSASPPHLPTFSGHDAHNHSRPQKRRRLVWLSLADAQTRWIASFDPGYPLLLPMPR